MKHLKTISLCLLLMAVTATSLAKPPEPQLNGMWVDVLFDSDRGNHMQVNTFDVTPGQGVSGTIDWNLPLPVPNIHDGYRFFSQAFKVGYNPSSQSININIHLTAWFSHGDLDFTFSPVITVDENGHGNFPAASYSTNNSSCVVHTVPAGGYSANPAIQLLCD